MRQLNLLAVVLILSTISMSLSVGPQMLTKGMLNILVNHTSDYTLNFVFYNENVMTTLLPQFQRWQDTNVRVYLNDCKENHMQQCENEGKHMPLLLIHNHLLIRYSGKEDNLIEMVEWIQKRIEKKPTIINTHAQLETYIESNNNAYCFANNPQKGEERASFFALAKTLIFPSFCLLQNQQLISNLSLKPGNLTLFLNSTTNRKEWEHHNRVNAWEWFMKKELFQGWKRSKELVQQRFTQKEKNIDVILIICDFSFGCEKTWGSAMSLSPADAYIGFMDKDQSFLFNLYYHLTFDYSKLPALVHISLKSDGARAGDLQRYIKYLDKEEIDKTTLSQFRAEIKEGKIEKVVFTEEPFKNNGFFGKGSQKLIQKLSATTFNSTIQNSQNHMVVLFTAVGIGCAQCQQFYVQYKKVASYLVDQPITFALLNVNKNEVSQQHIQNLPDLLLYKKGETSHPIRMLDRKDFDRLIKFIGDNIQLKKEQL